MRAPTALTAAALATAAALLITSCGSSGKAPSTINGAQTGAPSVSATPTDPNAAKRPALEASKDFNAAFEGWTSSDPKSSAVLLDGKDQVLAVNSAIFKLNPDAPEVSFYNSDDALTSAKSWVAGFKKNQLTMTGTIRYYNPRVAFSSQGLATLLYCSDESKGFSKSLKTGNVLTTPASESNYVLYSTSLARDSRGIWQTISLNTTRGKCQP